MPLQLADRLRPLQSNVFADMDRAKTQAQAAGQTLIDLSLGSSDLPTPPHVLAAIAQSLSQPQTHGYLLHQGTQTFREAAARWYSQKFGIPVDPDREVQLLIGSQEGTAHLPLAILNPGDYALLTDPTYPSHPCGIHLANGRIHWMPLRPENHFLPALEEIPDDILAQARRMVLSYPPNPPGALAPRAFGKRAVALCQTYGIVLAHDFPYPDYGPADQPAPPSILQADPDKQVSIEFFSLSKSYNMGGFRVGYAIGNATLIAALRQLKAVIDFNQYSGILAGAIAALTGPQDCVAATQVCFRERRDGFVAALHRIGWEVPLPPLPMYCWAPLPSPWQQDSIGFCKALVAATGVAVAPGVGFGKMGEGFVRFALVHDLPVLEEAVDRIARFLSVHRAARPNE